jgi:hypothetical protein
MASKQDRTFQRQDIRSCESCKGTQSGKTQQNKITTTKDTPNHNKKNNKKQQQQKSELPWPSLHLTVLLFAQNNV